MIQELLERRGIPCFVVGEELRTFEGSGAAMLHTLIDGGEKTTMFMLAAGEGSRLWGISMSLGFVKGLVDVFGQTLIELSYHQGQKILQWAPPDSDFIFCTGTDNILESKRPMDAFRASKSRGIHTFSIPISVRDKQHYERLSQLGIMLCDSTQSAVVFVEKPSHLQIEAMVNEYRCKDVYVNAFMFAMSREAGELLRILYRNLYELPLDWSAHVLAPLSLVHRGGSKEDWLNCQSESDPLNSSDFGQLFECAREFYEQFGPIHVIDVGADSVWYDCGLASDLFSLYHLELDSFNVARVGATETLVGGCHGEIPSFTNARNCSFGGCTFSNDHSLSAAMLNNLVFVDCDLSCELPVGLFDDVSNSMFYKVDFARFLGFWKGKPLESNSVYFSYKDEFGVFPIDKNPKNGSLLSEAIEGLSPQSDGSPSSFRNIQLAFNRTDYVYP